MFPHARPCNTPGVNSKYDARSTMVTSRAQCCSSSAACSPAKPPPTMTTLGRCARFREAAPAHTTASVAPQSTYAASVMGRTGSASSTGRNNNGRTAPVLAALHGARRAQPRRTQPLRRCWSIARCLNSGAAPPAASFTRGGVRCAAPLQSGGVRSTCAIGTTHRCQARVSSKNPAQQQRAGGVVTP